MAATGRSRALDQIGDRVDSAIRFFHFVEADQKTLCLQQWSTRTLTEFCRAEGKGLHYPYDHLPLETADGRIVEVEFVSNVYLVDHAKVIQCNIRDITERKQADAERERLLSAIEQADAMIVMTDPDGTIQYVNPAFEKVTGYTRDEAIGQNPRMLKSGKQGPGFYRNLWETISGGHTFKGRMINKRKDGTFFTEGSTISPVRDPAGRIVSYVAVKRDITENLNLAAQFQQAQKMESVRRLAGGVAHDYNNMLSVIIGYTELALDRVDPSDPLHADLKEINMATMRSTEITIETHSVTFDAAYCADHGGFVPGDFVMLAVSDDGCGMDKETLDNIFEPFFTTKDVHLGTGLGLATVFGIVKQNNGFINVYSEPGQGTTFRIYLVRHVGAAEKSSVETVVEIPASRGETVLLVEDEAAIIHMCQLMLEKLGYQVLTTARQARPCAWRKITPVKFTCSSPTWSCLK